MRQRTILLGFAATSLLAASTLPAAAQLDDFLCSTFNYKCEQPAPPPPPQLAPESAPASAPEPTKHARKAHKHKAKAKAAKTEAAAPPAASDATPK